MVAQIGLGGHYGRAPFQAIVKASFGHHAPPSKNGSIGVIFDPSNHSKLAIYPGFAFSDMTSSARKQETIAASLGRHGMIRRCPARPAAADMSAVSAFSYQAP